MNVEEQAAYQRGLATGLAKVFVAVVDELTELGSASFSTLNLLDVDAESAPSHAWYLLGVLEHVVESGEAKRARPE
ncbi:MAG: hypothetical protein GEV08_06230 [Acidimicrobiia bacterium]|nr:hypothetical protein [Acidimicrobiia bacterium]